MVVLHPVLVAHIAGIARGIIAVGRQAVDLEAFARDLRAGVGLSVGGRGHPLLILCIGVVGRDADLSAVGDLLLVPLDPDRRHHRLAGVAEAARRTVVEHVPLAVDLLQRAVRVVGGIGGHQVLAVLVGHHAARVHEHAAGAPRPEGRVAVAVTQGGVGGFQPVVRAAVTGEDHHVLVAHLADAGGFEEVEFARILALVERGVLRSFRIAHHAVTRAGGQEVIVDLGAGAEGIHRVRIQFDGGGMLETVIGVGPEAAREIGILLVGHRLDEDRRVEVDDGAGQAAAAVRGGVDRGERAVGAVGLAHHRDAPAPAGVRIQVIGLLAGGLVTHLHEVGGVHRVPLAVHVPGEDGAFVAPLREVLDGRGPHPDVASAVGGVGDVVRADDVGAVFPGVVRVFEDAGFSVGEMLPEGDVGVLGRGREGGEQQQCG